MKKILYILIVCLGVLFLQACEKENFDFLDKTQCGEECVVDDSRGLDDDSMSGGVIDNDDDDDDQIIDNDDDDDEEENEDSSEERAM